MTQKDSTGDATKKNAGRTDQSQAGLNGTMGSATGQRERIPQAGGWSGTDDATSTAPSDQIGNPPAAEEEKPFHTITRDFDESIQSDEQAQQERAVDCDEQSEKAAAEAKQSQQNRWHRLAAKVRAAHKKPPA